jgi:hypothetical protein
MGMGKNRSGPTKSPRNATAADRWNCFRNGTLAANQAARTARVRCELARRMNSCYTRGASSHRPNVAVALRSRPHRSGQPHEPPIKFVHINVKG